jgi:hypothetical protein
VYVGAVAVLTFVAFHDRNATFGMAEAIAMLLTLPTLIGAIPLIYVGGAAIRNVTNADNGGPMWPVTLVYVLMFAAVAVGNVLLLRALVASRRRKATA